MGRHTASKPCHADVVPLRFQRRVDRLEGRGEYMEEDKDFVGLEKLGAGIM